MSGTWTILLIAPTYHMNILNLFSFFDFLKYNWFTVLCWFLLCCRVIQSHTHALFRHGLSPLCCTEGPCLSILYMLAYIDWLQPQLDPSLNPAPLTTPRSVLCVCETVHVRWVSPAKWMIKIMRLTGKDRGLKHVTNVGQEMCPDRRNASYHLSKSSLAIKPY